MLCQSRLIKPIFLTRMYIRLQNEALVLPEVLQFLGRAVQRRHETNWGQRPSSSQPYTHVSFVCIS